MLTLCYIKVHDSSYSFCSTINVSLTIILAIATLLISWYGSERLVVDQYVYHTYHTNTGEATVSETMLLLSHHVLLWLRLLLLP